LIDRRQGKNVTQSSTNQDYVDIVIIEEDSTAIVDHFPNIEARLNQNSQIDVKPEVSLLNEIAQIEEMTPRLVIKKVNILKC
jgi:hypothetical protein